MLQWRKIYTFLIIISFAWGEITHFSLENLRSDYNPSEKVKFYLYTRQNSDTPREIFNGNLDHLYASGFRRIPVKVLVHGWKCDANHTSNILSKNDGRTPLDMYFYKNPQFCPLYFSPYHHEYILQSLSEYANISSIALVDNESASLGRFTLQTFLKHYDVNVIVVDWRSGMDENPSDPLAVAVGMYLATFLQFLGRAGVPLSQVHVVAHSLGAHAAAHAGRNCMTGKIGYISALDPPGETSRWENSTYCIGRGDADYVEIIHTFIAGGMLIYPYGHVDFYPNGGEVMPGCLLTDEWCSHSRAYEYFAESIGLEDGFIGRECRDYEEMRQAECNSLNRTLQMGGHLPKNASGIYILETNPQEPFHKGFR